MPEPDGDNNDIKDGTIDEEKDDASVRVTQLEPSSKADTAEVEAASTGTDDK